MKNGLPRDVKGIAFVIHSDCDNKWELDILGTYNKEYLPEDEDWATDDFTSLHEAYAWIEKINEEELIKDIERTLKDYLLNGQYSDELKSLEAVGLSFDDSEKVIFLHLKKDNK